MDFYALAFQVPKIKKKKDGRVKIKWKEEIGVFEAENDQEAQEIAEAYCSDVEVCEDEDSAYFLERFFNLYKLSLVTTTEPKDNGGTDG